MHDEPSSRLNASRSEPRPGLGLAAVLVVAALLLVFFNLGDYRTLGRHEAYAAVPAREMLESGDWIVPRFAGVPRLQKPPLEYWLIAASASVCGGLEEWTARLPAALSALALAGLVGAWGARWHGRMAGIAAAAAVLSSQFVLTYSRRAEVDLPLCLLTTGAMFLIANQPAGERGGRAFVRWVAVYLLLAVSWLAKFHYGATMVLAPAVAWFVVQRRWRSLAQMLNPVGLALLAAAIFVWPALLVEQVPEAVAVWKAETLGRALGRLGRQPIWYYGPHVLAIIAPWTPLVLLAAPRSLRQAWSGAFATFRARVSGGRRATIGTAAQLASAADDPRERLLWIWLAVHLVGLSASAGKHPHYLGATFPMLALLAGQGTAQVAARIRGGSWRLSRRGAIAGTFVAAAGSAVCLVVAGRRWPALASTSWAAAAILAVGGTASLWLVRAGRYRPAVAAFTLMFVGCYALANGPFMQAEDYRRHTAEFAAAVRTEYLGRQIVYAYALGMRPAAYYMQSPVRRVETLAELQAALEQAGSLPVVTPLDRVLELGEAGTVEVFERMADRPRGRRRTIDPPLAFAVVSRQTPQPSTYPRESPILRAGHAAESGGRR